MSKFYEDPTTRELRSLREIQGSAYNSLRQIQVKLDEVGQTQLTHTSYLQRCVNNGQQQQPGGTASIQQVGGKGFY